MSESVSREKLIRRATFDLTGVTPKWTDVQAFVTDKRPDAFTMVMINRGVRDKVTGGFKAIDHLNLNRNAPPRSMTVEESLDAPVVHVFLRGNPVNRGAMVAPRFLSSLADTNETFTADKRRLGLAKAIVSNPLAQRMSSVSMRI
ncbi:MAG: hypothetical protein CMO80_12840 [Verrucomicrobiales bacterium]|nr:hypothetical protein [Verrucomicrobiales bacterium]